MPKGKILIADDSEVVAGVVAQYLEMNDFEVHRAVNGIEGVEKAYKIIPDLIVMDVEMPLMKGYQASRFLKSRRFVKDIPIILHTTLSEDKDKFWGFSSGADEFVTKDFDNLETLLEKIERLIENKPFYKTEAIQKEAEKIDKDTIFEIQGNLFDDQLFQSTILNELSNTVSSMGLNNTLQDIFKIFQSVCQYHIVVVFLQYDKKTLCFIKPGKEIYEKDLQDFYEICIEDYFEIFPDLQVEKIQRTVFGITDRPDFRQIRLDQNKISSYTYFELLGKGENPIGAFHIGNLSNNYFSETILENISVFIKGVSVILENLILFEEMKELNVKIKNVFSKFVPADIIDDMIQRQKSSSLLMSEKRNLVVLFADIRSFTNIAEYNSADKVVAFLNIYFEAMVSIITSMGGTIDKFIGDAILAVFGAPKSYEDNAMRAVKSAVKMIQALKDLDTSFLKLPENRFNIGIGIHEGEAIVGNIGSKDKFDYTVIGDTVNLASRLEGLTKHYHQHILVSSTVKEKVEKDFYLREVDNAKVKGKNKVTVIYTVEVDNEKNYLPDTKKNYSKAISMYKMKNFQTSIEYFRKVLAQIPDDSMSKMYIERCENYLKNPPPEDWDGSITFDFK